MDGSASRVNLLLNCQFWARDDVQGPPNESGEGALYGIAVHGLTESLGTGKRVSIPPLSELDHLQATVDANALYTWHTQHIGGVKHHEQKVAFNIHNRTARVLTRPEPRDYSECSEQEFPGTADLIAVKPGVVCVVDYKTGHTPWEIYKDQLNFLGLCAAKIHNAERAVCVVLKVSDGECFPHHWVLEQGDLESFENRFVTAWSQIPNADPVFGPHCTSLYCPLAGTCPATLNAITTETGVPTDDIKTDASIADHEHAARLYQIKLLLGKSRDVLDSQLKKYVDLTGGFPLPNGKQYMKKGSYREVRLDTRPADDQNSVADPKTDPTGE